jgi:hypothetical protein
MDEMNNEINRFEELALRFLESPEELTEEEMLLLTSDVAFKQTCKDLYDCRNAVREEYILDVPNVDKEWDKFQSKVHGRSKGRIFMIGGLVSMAASIILILLFPWFKGIYLSHKSVVVFQANSNPQQVVLTTSSGEKIVLNNNTQDASLNDIGAKMSDSGSVEYEGANAAKVQTHILSTPRGLDFKVVLADGTTVWLNAESRLEYPSRFVGKERIVRLQGEAYFEVAKDKEHPFIIRTNNLQTRVLGTEFNVRNYSAHDSHVTLIQGSVEVRSAKGGSYTKIKPGMDAHLADDGSFDLKEVDVDTYIYWKEGFFYFDNVSLVEIMQSLGRWYNVNVVFRDKRAMEYKMHYMCDRKEGLDQAITLLNRMKKVTVRQDGNTIYIDE